MSNEEKKKTELAKNTNDKKEPVSDEEKNDPKLVPQVKQTKDKMEPMPEKEKKDSELVLQENRE